MPFFFFGTRADGRKNDQVKRSNDGEKFIPCDPSPSLWPEPAHPIPAAVRLAEYNTTSKIPDTARRAVEGAHVKREESIYTASAVSSVGFDGTSAGSGSTFPSSHSTTSSPPSRPIDITVTDIFEPRYPTWHSYPPIHPTHFDPVVSSTPIKSDLFNPTDTFLQKSSAFQDWVNKKNAERIKLRHGPDYIKLVDELNNLRLIATEGSTPAIRANAKHHISRIKEAMSKERQKFSAAELQLIRDIEKGWVSFVSIGSYERAVSRQRELSAIPRAVPKPRCALSEVELLLGSDGSSPEASSWTRPFSVASQPTLYRMASWDEVATEFMETDHGDEKGRPPKAPLPDKTYTVLIPDWFEVFESVGDIKISGSTVENLYRSLLNLIYELLTTIGQLKYKEAHPDAEGVVKDYTWDKNWHSPNPGWPHEHHRERGGLWKCCKGPMATDAENNCKKCPDNDLPKPVHPQKVLDDVMNTIGEAMALVAEKDRKAMADNKKSNTTRLAEFQKKVGEDAEKLWALQLENPTGRAKSGSLSFGRRPFPISYDPLRDLDTSREAAKAAARQQIEAKKQK